MKKKKIFLLESNVDDCTPEQLSYLMERVMDEGALDIHVLQAMMKKGRLGYLIRVLTREPEKFSKILMEETGTLGVRFLELERFEADRETREIEVKIQGRKEVIHVKESEYGTKPESDDLQRIAKKHKIPLSDVLRMVEDQL